MSSEPTCKHSGVQNVGETNDYCYLIFYIVIEPISCNQKAQLPCLDISLICLQQLYLFLWLGCKCLWAVSSPPPHPRACKVPGIIGSWFRRETPLCTTIMNINAQHNPCPDNLRRQKLEEMGTT